jgi:5-methylcytosine-specific restriction endonuclease McrA
MDNINKIIDVVKGWNYQNRIDREAICHKCKKVSRRNEMAYIPIASHDCFYCFNCVYDVIDSEKKICPACRNYYIGNGRPFCEDCRQSDEAKRIAHQVYSQLNRTKDPRDNLTILEWFDTLRYYGFSCAYCRDRYAELDHFVPVSRGGATTIGNSVPACFDCNRSKHDTMPYVFAGHAAAEIETYLREREGRYVMGKIINQMSVDVLNSWYYCVTG